MRMKPILFSTPMVQAILDGRKTQTRRIIKKIPSGASKIWHDGGEWIVENKNKETWNGNLKPKYQIGDILWVRETWAKTVNVNSDEDWPGRPHKVIEELDEHKTWIALIYRADGWWEWCDGDGFSTERSYWKPSIYMPKEAARIFLKVTNVRVEHLQDISEEDAIAEGVLQHSDYGSTGYKHYGRPDEAFTDIDAIWSFETLWKSINGENSWNENPFVWVYEFERTEKPEN